MLSEKARFLRILGDETKLRIIEHLLDGEACACTFMDVTGRAQSTISTQIRDLEKAGILASRRDGRNIRYRIKDPRVKKLCTLLGIEGKKGECCP